MPETDQPTPDQPIGGAALRRDGVVPDRPDRPGHPGLPATPTDGVPTYDRGLAAQLAPFVAWMATQEIPEPQRRAHRQAAEDFLRWVRTDPGPEFGRRRRYELFLAQRNPAGIDHGIRAGLDRLAEYRALLARTLPVDH